MSDSEHIEIISSLLRYALWSKADGEVLRVHTRMPANDLEWNELLNVARKQLVLPLVVDGLEGLPENLRPSVKVVMGIAEEIERTEVDNHVINALSMKIKHYFEKKGLHPIIQKGAVIAAYYPIPTHRQTGDIDIFLKADEWRKGCDFIWNEYYIGDEHGLRISYAKMSSDDSLCFVLDGRTVELHNRFYDSRYEFLALDKHGPEAHIAMMSAHALKHCLGSGIRMKQLCDYAVGVYSFKYDKALVDREIKKAGLTKWQKTLDDCAEYLRYGETCSSESGGNSRDGDVRPHKVNKGISSLKSIMGRSYVYDGGISEKYRKLLTIWGFVASLPFALKYAPREWVNTVKYLVKGNLD